MFISRWIIVDVHLPPWSHWNLPGESRNGTHTTSSWMSWGIRSESRKDPKDTRQKESRGLLILLYCHRVDVEAWFSKSSGGPLAQHGGRTSSRVATSLYSHHLLLPSFRDFLGMFIVLPSRDFLLWWGQPERNGAVPSGSEQESYKIYFNVLVCWF